MPEEDAASGEGDIVKADENEERRNTTGYAAYDNEKRIDHSPIGTIGCDLHLSQM